MAVTSPGMVLLLHPQSAEGTQTNSLPICAVLPFKLQLPSVPFVPDIVPDEEAHEERDGGGEREGAAGEDEEQARVETRSTRDPRPRAGVTPLSAQPWQTRRGGAQRARQRRARRHGTRGASPGGGGLVTRSAPSPRSSSLASPPSTRSPPPTGSPSRTPTRHSRLPDTQIHYGVLSTVHLRLPFWSVVSAASSSSGCPVVPRIQGEPMASCALNKSTRVIHLPISLYYLSASTSLSAYIQ